MNEYSDIFLQFLMEQEHPDFLRGKAPALHESPEGGNPTVGFGHKLTDEEVKSGQVYGFDIYNMTPEQARQVMMIDLGKAEEGLKRELGDDFNTLDQTRKEMLLDFQYNLGSAKKKFPTFTQAVIDNDVETMNKEYKRGYYVGPRKPENFRELRKRNNAFAVTFLPTAEGVEAFEDLPEVPTEPGTLDFDLPPMQAEPVEQEVSGDELQGRPTFLRNLF